MTRLELLQFASLLFDECADVLKSKGTDYDRDEALSACKTLAAQYGVRPDQVLGIMLNKHLIAIDSRIATGQVNSEPIESRIHDAINYLVLLAAYYSEQEDDDADHRRK